MSQSAGLGTLLSARDGAHSLLEAPDAHHRLAAACAPRDRLVLQHVRIQLCSRPVWWGLVGHHRFVALRAAVPHGHDDARSVGRCGCGCGISIPDADRYHLRDAETNNIGIVQN